MDYWLIWALLGLLDLRGARSLFVTDINVPQIVDFRDNVTLSCSYEMSGHTLNSVKWYKDKMEFFRYSPLMHPVYLKFPVAGVQVMNDKNLCNEFSCRVDLGSLGVKSSGVYRCEVSGDAPHFKLTARSANMSVAALPQVDPQITSFGSEYRFDDFVHANCTTDFSSFAVQLSWFVNGEKAAFVDLQPAIETTVPAHEYQLRRQTLQLNFYANDPRFQRSTKAKGGRANGEVSPGAGAGGQQQQLSVRCVADIADYPELQREATLSARLMLHDEHLKNQKLINSGAARLSALLQLQLLPLLLLLLVVTVRTATVTQLTFQYGGHKSKRIKYPPLMTAAPHSS